MVTGWMTDRMGFNLISLFNGPFNGQQKNGLLNGAKDGLKCEPTFIWPDMFRKLYENERNWTDKGTQVHDTPVDLPTQSKE